MANKGNKLGLKWEGFQDSARLTFANLRESLEFADVTLACEDGHAVEAHKLILSSSSPVLGNILRRTSQPPDLPEGSQVFRPDDSSGLCVCRRSNC